MVRNKKKSFPEVAICAKVNKLGAKNDIIRSCSLTNQKTKCSKQEPIAASTAHT